MGIVMLNAGRNRVLLACEQNWAEGDSSSF
jgi:hypothetical protein